MASPMKKTSLPTAPVCQPVTASVRPFGSVPAYQSVNAEIVRTSPETHATRTPQLPTTGVARSGRGGRSGRVRKGRAGSGVCTGAVWAKKRTGARGVGPSPRTRGGAGRRGSGRGVREGAEPAGRAAARRRRIRRVCRRRNGRLRRVPLQRLRLRGGRPAGLPPCPMCGGTVWESPGSALRGLTRPVAVRSGRNTSAVTGLLDVDRLADVRLGAPSLAALVRAVTAAAASTSSSDALRGSAEAAQAVSGAEIALVRALDEGGERLEAVAVAAPQTLAAELYGTVLPAAELPAAPLDDLARAPAAVRRIGERIGASRLFCSCPPARTAYAVSLELFRSGEPFGARAATRRGALRGAGRARAPRLCGRRRRLLARAAGARAGRRGARGRAAGGGRRRRGRPPRRRRRRGVGRDPLGEPRRRARLRRVVGRRRRAPISVPRARSPSARSPSPGRSGSRRRAPAGLRRLDHAAAGTPAAGRPPAAPSGGRGAGRRTAHAARDVRRARRARAAHGRAGAAARARARAHAGAARGDRPGDGRALRLAHARDRRRARRRAARRRPGRRLPARHG